MKNILFIWIIIICVYNFEFCLTKNEDNMTNSTIVAKNQVLSKENNFKLSWLASPANAEYYLEMYGGLDDYKTPIRKKLYRLIKLDHNLYKRG
jgi:hypothetical protein